LTAEGKAAAMTYPAIAADLDEALDVLADLLSQLAFDRVVLIDVFADSRYFIVGEVADLGLDGYVGGGADFLRGGNADTEDIPEGDLDSLITRYVYACNTGHWATPASACAAGWSK
jgi:hypothetical protein